MNYWLAQCNPDKFRLLDYWRECYLGEHGGLLDWWLMHKINMPGRDKEILYEDIVFIWKADGKAKESKNTRGIYAKAKVIDVSGNIPADNLRRLEDYFISDTAFSKFQRRATFYRSVYEDIMPNRWQETPITRAGAYTYTA